MFCTISGVLLLILSVHADTSLWDSRICFYHEDEGPCNKTIKRYYYNATIGECVMFTYGGCGGNANNSKHLKNVIQLAGKVVGSIEKFALWMLQCLDADIHAQLGTMMCLMIDAEDGMQSEMWITARSDIQNKNDNNNNNHKHRKCIRITEFHNSSIKNILSTAHLTFTCTEVNGIPFSKDTVLQVFILSAFKPPSLVSSTSFCLSFWLLLRIAHLSSNGVHIICKYMTFKYKAQLELEKL
uniref:BPTI/Kunitz inhibitor domain-containing protein n=1 Tax=Trichobilharzia regenti TaxID=157069 RepID=A0AA85K5P2_TRIRE|nr:unnamed protein product [Trichobilharzia regenti]